jgi:hypothetical protein
MKLTFKEYLLVEGAQHPPEALTKSVLTFSMGYVMYLIKESDSLDDLPEIYLDDFDAFLEKYPPINLHRTTINSLGSQLKLFLNFSGKFDYHKTISRIKRAAYMPDITGLVLGMRDIHLQFLNKSATLSDIEHELETSINHELIHFVQDKVLSKRHKDQVDTAGAGSVADDDYYSSPVEFLPMVDTNVRQFLYHTKKAGISKKQSTQAAKEFVGAVKTNEYFEPSKFFRALKVKNYDNWKIAVKKFYKEIGMSA